METSVDLVEIPESFQGKAGHVDYGTRIYRREGNHDEMVAWFDALCEHFGGCVSPGGAAVYAGVTRAGVYKRLKAGKLTAFCFHITQEKKTFFGGRKTLKDGPIVYIPVSECQGWRKELESRVARIEAEKRQIEEDATAPAETGGDEEAWDGSFLENDPKDKGRKNFRKARPWEELRG